MSTTALALTGIDAVRDGWRIRMTFHGVRHTRVVATQDAAITLRAQWRELKAAGLAPEAAPADVTVREACDALLAAKRTLVSRKTKRRLSERTLEAWEAQLRPWREGALGDLPVSLLRADTVRRIVVGRAAKAPTAAKHELEGIKAALLEAERGGAEIASAILRIEPVVTEPAPLHAFTADELEWLAGFAPAYARDQILFLGTSGMRQGEAWTLTTDRVDLRGRRVFIPAALCKERRDKWVPLTDEEVDILRRALKGALARPGNSRLVFPTREGSQWRRSWWRKLVVAKVRAGAGAAWREENGDGASPYDGFRTHWLRATAATLMRDAGIPRELAAARLGHADAGELLERIYDHGDRELRLADALATHAPTGLRAAAKSAPRRQLHEGDATPTAATTPPPRTATTPPGTRTARA